MKSEIHTNLVSQGRRISATIAAFAGICLAGSASVALAGQGLSDLGPNVHVFDSSMPTAEIKAAMDEIWEAQVDDEMGGNRHAIFFMPGTYGSAAEPLQVKVGYYTEVHGLGASPLDVTINGKVEVFNRCFDDPTNPEFVGCFALNNFWRGISNLSIEVNGAG